MNNQLGMFLIVDVAILLALIITKTIFFVAATRRRSLLNWIHFNRFNLINSTEVGKKLKGKQNAWTVLIFIFIIISLLAYLGLATMG